MMIKKAKERGLTFIEVLVAVAVGAIVLVALFSLAGRFFGLSRTQVEQGRIVEDAKVEMERMSDAIRNARNVDFDGDGQFSGGEERWIRRAGPGEIVMYTNADADDEPEMVRYWLDGDDLMRGVTELTGGGEVTEVLARSFRNVEQVRPLFTFYSLGGIKAEAVDSSFDLKAIDRVGIFFVVDVDESKLPAAALVDTVVTPRRGYIGQTTGTAPALPPPAPAWPTP